MIVTKCKSETSRKVKDKIQWQNKSFTTPDQTWKYDSGGNDDIMYEIPMTYFMKYFTEELLSYFPTKLTIML